MIEREARLMRHGVGSIPVAEGITLTPDELRTWEVLYETRGDVAMVARMLGVTYSTAKNKLYDLYSGLHVNGRSNPRTRACMMGFYLLDRAKWRAEQQGIEWRRGPYLKKAHWTKVHSTMQEALAG